MPEVGADVEALDRLGRGLQFQSTCIQSEIVDWIDRDITRHGGKDRMRNSSGRSGWT